MPSSRLRRASASTSTTAGASRKGGATGSDWNLSCDVRPKVPELKDGGPADAEPTAAAVVKEVGERILKPRILPTGNGFIDEPSRRFVRPAADPGSKVPYLQAAFDDRAWQTVDLPHDWATDGPFVEKGSGGGMGRLPTAGEGWYRKK